MAQMAALKCSAILCSTSVKNAYTTTPRSIPSGKAGSFCFTSRFASRLNVSTTGRVSGKDRRTFRSPVTAAAGGGGGNVGGGGRVGTGGGGGGGFSSGGGGLPQQLAFGFAILVAIGGYMGYKNKGSKDSLKSSTTFAAVLFVAGYLIGGPYPTAGLAIALAANVALGWYMVKGYLNTKKAFPQGVFSAVSIVSSFVYFRSLSARF